MRTAPRWRIRAEVIREPHLQALTVEIWILVLAISFAAGFVKGVVGFAMPMLMISGLGSLLAPEAALAALIVPTLVTNVWQGVRGGIAAARASAKAHWRYLLVVAVMISLSAQLVTVMPDWSLFLVLGVPVVLFSLAQLAGWRLRIVERTRRMAEVVIAAFAGLIGGLSGVWGPPTVIYLTALETPKAEHVRVQGVVYALGSVVLLVAHMRSGVFNSGTAPLSFILLVPALAGVALGFRVQDRMDQQLFRKATLVVLIVAGLNLVRRGLLG